MLPPLGKEDQDPSARVGGSCRQRLPTPDSRDSPTLHSPRCDSKTGLEATASCEGSKSIAFQMNALFCLSAACIC